MTPPKVRPERDEVEAIGKLLGDIDAQSRHELRHFLAGQTDWRLAQRIIKRCINRLVHDSKARLRRDHRERLLEYAARYGLRIGSTLADVPMTETFRFVCTPDQKDELERAAREAGYVDNASAWGRDVLLREAAKLRAAK